MADLLDNVTGSVFSAAPKTPAPSAEHDRWFRHAVPFLAPLVVACLNLVVLNLPLIPAGIRLAVLAVVFILVVAVASGSSYFLVRDWGASVPHASLVAGTVGFLLIQETDAARYAAVVLSGLLSAAHLVQLERRHHGADREDERRLELMLLAPAAFFVLSFAFAAKELSLVPSWAAGAVVGALSAFIARSVVMRRPEIKAVWTPAVVASGVLGFQVFVVLALLPTKPIVSGAVAVILLSLVGHRVHDDLVPGDDCLAYRRHLALSVLLVVIILATAQWL